MHQTINVTQLNRLPYGINKEYMTIVKPSGIVRTWVGVDSSTPRQNVNHEISLTVIFKNEHLCIFCTIKFL